MIYKWFLKILLILIILYSFCRKLKADYFGKGIIVLRQLFFLQLWKLWFFFRFFRRILASEHAPRKLSKMLYKWFLKIFLIFMILYSFCRKLKADYFGKGSHPINAVKWKRTERTLSHDPLPPSPERTFKWRSQSSFLGNNNDRFTTDARKTLITPLFGNVSLPNSYHV